MQWKYRLFRSYCTSLYGCELWSLTTNKLHDLCMASVLCRTLIPQFMPSYMLPLICNCLPVFDEIYQRSNNFACIMQESGADPRGGRWGRSPPPKTSQGEFFYPNSVGYFSSRTVTPVVTGKYLRMAHNCQLIK